MVQDVTSVHDGDEHENVPEEVNKHCDDNLKPHFLYLMQVGLNVPCLLVPVLHRGD